jgi:adenylylsulfate kinase
MNPGGTAPQQLKELFFMADDVKATNITWHQADVTRADREKKYGHRAVVLWFTGLSGSGKSTLAHAVEDQLVQRECHTYVLDGDNIRHGLCKDLGFSPQAREENIRRIGEVAKLFNDAGVIALTAFISPYREDRDKARQISGDSFIEVYVKCDLDVCEQRDPKGLYKKARAGEINEFTGISAPYEEPENAELLIDTSHESLEESAAKVIAFLEQRGLFAAV